jgi:enoyl-CoA hydratase
VVTPLPVTQSVVESVGVLELSRPEKFNCLSQAVLERIHQGIKDFEAGGKVRAVLIQSTGKHFCTGADLDEVKALRQDRRQLARFIEIGQAAFMALEESPLPVVGAVQGLCLAGGMELMLACDVIFAAKTARFGDQHAQYGLLPGWGGSQRLPRLVGLRRSLDLFLSARWIDAEAAQGWGLVNHVAPDDKLHIEAMQYCQTLTERSRPGLAAMKRLARQGTEMALAAGLRLEVGCVVDGILSDDADEGLAAFEARRKPKFG